MQVLFESLEYMSQPKRSLSEVWLVSDCVCGGGGGRAGGYIQWNP